MLAKQKVEGSKGRGTQVVREGSAKPRFVGSNPTRASTSDSATKVFILYTTLI